MRGCYSHGRECVTGCYNIQNDFLVGNLFLNELLKFQKVFGKREQLFSCGYDDSSIGLQLTIYKITTG